MGQTQKPVLTIAGSQAPPASVSQPQTAPALGARTVASATGHGIEPGRASTTSWLGSLRRFLAFIAAGNLVWEVAQLPLYSIWYEGTPREIAFAVAHCTGGDVLIASASLLLALLIAARPTWPHETYGRVAALTVAFAVPYTVFSEWLNTEVRGSWAYADAMPVVPLIDAGLSPVAQWIVIPIAAFWWARPHSEESQ